MNLKSFTVGLVLTLLALTTTACRSSPPTSSTEIANSEAHRSLESAPSATDNIPEPCNLAKYIQGADARCDYLNRCAESVSFHDPEQAKAVMSLVGDSQGACDQTKITIVRDLYPHVRESFETLVRCQTILASAVVELDEVSEDVEALEKDLAEAIMEHFHAEDAGCVEKLARVAAGAGGSPHFVQAYLDRFGHPGSFQEARLLLQILYARESSREIVHETGLSLLPRSINLATDWFEMNALAFAIPEEDPVGYSYAQLRREVSLKRGELQ